MSAPPEHCKGDNKSAQGNALENNRHKITKALKGHNKR
jgi:hypothetical protein